MGIVTDGSMAFCSGKKHADQHKCLKNSNSKRRETNSLPQLVQSFYLHQLSMWSQKRRRQQWCTYYIT